jgi:hypothetical protein
LRAWMTCLTSFSPGSWRSRIYPDWSALSPSRHRRCGRADRDWLPHPVSGTPGPLLVDWPGAEQRGFAGLATHAPGGVSALRHARTLAAGAGATTGIATTGIATTGIELLLTNVLLAPISPPVLLAKAAARIDQLSNGRLTLGLAPGGPSR